LKKKLINKLQLNLKTEIDKIKTQNNLFIESMKLQHETEVKRMEKYQQLLKKEIKLKVVYRNLIV